MTKKAAQAEKSAQTENKAPADESEPKETAKPPVDRVRLWPVEAAIWEQDGEAGKYHNVTVQRTYKDGDKYRSTHSLRTSDLLIAAKALDQAHTRILHLQDQARSR